MSTIAELQVRARRNAVAHGFTESSFVERLALVHSEVSEALEEYRDGSLPADVYWKESLKPEGVPIELADTVIRILDLCEAYGIDLEYAIEEKMKFNETRPFRHGGKVL